MRAGAEIILTSTYQASFEGFSLQGVEVREEVEGLLRGAVSIAEDALKEGKTHSGKEGKVVLGLGAYGATMRPSQEYTGKYDEEHATRKGLKDWHEERLRVFSEHDETWAKVENVAFETVPLLLEIEAVREVMFSVNADGNANDKSYWITCVFPGEGERLPDGSSIKEVVRALLGKREGAGRPSGVGINCTKVGKIEELLKKFETEVEGMIRRGELEDGYKPALVLYPDGSGLGEVYNTTTKEWEVKDGGDRGEAEAWDEVVEGVVKEAWERGVWSEIFVGGCCKTGPEDIGRLREKLDQFR